MGKLEIEGDRQRLSVRIKYEVTGHESSVRNLSGTSVSGDMRLSTALASAGEISIETFSGDASLQLD